MASAAQTPIAIIGLSCRFAGEASNPEKLWKLCAESRSAWSQFPSSRFNSDAFYHPNGQKLNTLNVRGGHFLSEDVALFDANFFNFSSELASVYDPQFRLQLELTYEALENAGLSLQDVAGSNTSVFAGVFFHDYNEMHMRDPETLPRALLISTGAAMASNRLSHFYDLRGASQTIDTGCSTTLTAFHQACQSIQSGDSDMSIISASNIILNPDNFMVMSSAFLSEAGRSYAFDSRASGYGRGEGSATVIVKRLDHALRDKDPIRAVVRATAVNQDGKTETITTPSQDAQADLIRECYRKAGLDPDTTTYFEAHGTGTPAGDPIEAGAIGSVFSRDGDRPDILTVGSVKTNIGHTETVSGLASIIKVVMALQNKQIPPSANFEKPNPNIPFEKYRIKIPTMLEDWPGQDGIRRASINNFGYGGANAHVILEDYDSYLKSNDLKIQEETLRVECTTSRQILLARSRIFTLSAKDEQAIRRMISELADHLRLVQPDCEETFLDSLAYTLGQRRSHLLWIYTCTAQSLPDLIKKLDKAQPPPIKRGEELPKIGYVMTGQGAQSWNMGRELIEAYPVYREILVEANQHLKDLGCSWDVLVELNKDAIETRVNELALSTPLSAILQIGLVELLRSWGIEPVALCSHSSGEVAAAYASGALTLRDAMAVVFARGKIAGTTNPGEKRGAMIATGLGPEELERLYLSRLPKGSVVVACLNSPSSTTASGDADAIGQLEQMLRQDNIFGRRLKIDCAYHSHHMQALSPVYRKYLDELLEGKGVMRPDVIYSSPTTGSREADGSKLSSANHWVESFARPVQFTKALHSMCFEFRDSTTSNVDAIIEIGPHSALGGPIQETVAQSTYHGRKIRYLPTLVRKVNAVDTMHALACELIKAGFAVNIGNLNFPKGYQQVAVLHSLPSYPWNHQKRHWSEPRLNCVHRHRLHADHDLLGSLVLGTNMLVPTWRRILRVSDLPWLRDHVIQTDVVFPAAAYICMAIQACQQLADIKQQVPSGYRFRDIQVTSALVIPDNAAGTEIQMSFTNPNAKAVSASGWTAFHVYSVTSDSNWNEHCSGLVRADMDHSASQDETMWVEHSAMDSYRKSLAPSAVYDALHHIEVKHGPAFRNLIQIRARDAQAVATFAVTDTAAIQPYRYQHAHVVHPTTLDALFQFAYANYIALPDADMSISFVPRLIKALYVSHSVTSDPGHVFKAFSEIATRNSQSFSANLVVVDNAPSGTVSVPVMSIDGYTTTSIGRIIQSDDSYRKLAKISWKPDITLLNHGQLRELMTPTNEIIASTFTAMRELGMSHIQEAVSQISRKDVSRMEPHQKYLYYWMLLRSEEYLNDKTFNSKRSDAYNSPDHTEDYPSKSKIKSGRNLISEVGPHLASIVKGSVLPSSIISEESLVDYFLEPTGLSECTDQIATYTRLLAHKQPKLRILHLLHEETASAVKIVQAIGINARDIIDRYEVVDTSGGCLNNDLDSQLGAAHSYITIRELEIEKSLDIQGSSINTYDLIIIDRASYTLDNPSKSLRNVQKLLKPGAHLIFTDTRRDLLDHWLLLGIFPEHWQIASHNKYKPALSTSTWETLLHDAGFTGIDHIFHDDVNKNHHSCRTILSRSCLNERNKNFPHVVIVTHGERPASSWLDEMSKALNCISGSAPSIQSLQDVVPEGKVCIFVGDVNRAFLKELAAEEFESIKKTVVDSKGLLWLTLGAAMDSHAIDNSLSQGFLRTLRTEYAGKRAISLDLDSNRPAWSHDSIGSIIEIFKASFDYEQPIDEFEYAVRDGVINVPRFYKDYERNDIFIPSTGKKQVAERRILDSLNHKMQLVIGTPGLLDSLSFVDLGDSNQDLRTNEIEIQPRAFGANFRDVMSAMGQLNTSTMGFECAGIIIRVGSAAFAAGFAPGDRVAALTNAGYSNIIRTVYTNVVHISDDLTFELAASIPKCYSSAYICLVDIARLQKDETVLINAAAGGLGQAAITIAKHIGAKVFVTASTPDKQQLLHKVHGIPREHIFNSRNNSFVLGILQATNNAGVDVVLNNLSGALLQESLNCLAQFGRFVDVGKKDFESDNSIQSGAFVRNVSFSSFDLLQYEEHRGTQVQQALKAVVRLLHLQKLSFIHPVIVRPLSEFEKVFRHLQSGKQIGKQVLSVNDDDMIQVTPYTPKVILDSAASYLVVGGLGGLGRTVCDWLISRGARNLIIMSRSATAEKISSLSEDVAQVGCRIYASQCDIADAESIRIAFDNCEKHMPPIRGIIQGAMVLQDSLVERMTLDQWKGAMKPKVHGSWNLHERLRMKEVDFFVMLSSLSGIVGLPAQCNYAAGNAYQDALAKFRMSQGLHAAAIDIGVVQAVGVVAENAKLAAGLKHWKAVTETEVLQVIESAILSSPRESLLIGISGADWIASGLERDRRFAILKPRDESISDGPISQSKAGELAGSISGAPSFADACDVVVKAIMKQLEQIFMMDEDQMDASKPLVAYGVDSLSAVELRNMLSLRAGAEVSIFEIMQVTSIQALGAIVAERSSYTDAALVSKGGCT